MRFFQQTALKEQKTADKYYDIYHVEPNHMLYICAVVLFGRRAGHCEPRHGTLKI